jgi:hypothetical protein
MSHLLQLHQHTIVILGMQEDNLYARHPVDSSEHCRVWRATGGSGLPLITRTCHTNTYIRLSTMAKLHHDICQYEHTYSLLLYIQCMV